MQKHRLAVCTPRLLTCHMCHWLHWHRYKKRYIAYLHMRFNKWSFWRMSGLSERISGEWVLSTWPVEQTQWTFIIYYLQRVISGSHQLLSHLTARNIAGMTSALCMLGRQVAEMQSGPGWVEKKTRAGVKTGKGVNREPDGGLCMLSLWITLTCPLLSFTN